MSVKRKFRKSKKTKGKSNKNKKYNNEKRSKIQRKTKKRVLRGGKGESCTRGNAVHSQLTDIDRLRGKQITHKQCIDLKTKIIKKGTTCLTRNAERELKTCGVNDINKLLQQNKQTLGSNVSEPKQVEANYAKDNSGEPLVPGSSGMEVNPGAPVEKINTPAPAEAALQEEDAETIKMQKIQEAEDQVAKDSEVKTDEMPDSTQTLALSKQHEDLADKYKNLEENEQDPDIKKIYSDAKEYHNRISTKLWITYIEQEETEKSKTSPGKETDAQAPAPAPTPANVQQDRTGTISQPIALNVAPEAEPINPEIVDNLQLFPIACFGQYKKCREKLNEAKSQSYFFYQFLKHMKEFFIKKCMTLDFESLISSDNIPKFSASGNLTTLYLNFFEFYNEHIAGDDDTKKFIVKRDADGKVITPNDDKGKPNIVMEQYPDIDLKTFFYNCYRLYNLSLPITCNFDLADSAYDRTTFLKNFDSPTELAESFNNFTPTIFSPTSIEEANLQKIIRFLDSYHQGYTKLIREPKYDSVLLDLKHYNAILPSDSSDSSFLESVLPVPRDSNGHSLLDFIEFIVQRKLFYPGQSIVCITLLNKTRGDIRDGVQNILTDSVIENIRKVVDSDSIFTTTCPFIAENPNIKQGIIDLITGNNKKINTPATFDFPTDEEKECAKKSGEFVTEANDSSNNFKTDIFFHMIIFACYNTKSKEKQWGIEGTNLMILFMNVFIIRFFNNILQQVIDFYSKLQIPDVGVMLIDKNASTLLEYIKELKKSFLDLEIKEKTKSAYRIDEDAIKELYAKFEQIEAEIQKRVKQKNDEQVKFTEGLNDYYAQESTGQPVQSTQKKTKLQEMNDFNLRTQMIELCQNLKIQVEKLYDKTYPGKREKWQNQQPVLEVTSDMSEEFDPDALEKGELVGIKEGCKDFVVTLISVARAIKAKKYFDDNGESMISLDTNGNNITKVHYDDAQLQQLNTCCDPRDIFAKGVDTTEHLKRISRAFYGLSEMWPYIIDKQKSKILKLPGVNALIEKFNTDTNFRTKVEWQCNDDGKAEKKGGLRWWGKSKNRKDIIQHINLNNLPQICKADVNSSPLQQQQTEPYLGRVVEEITPRSVKTPEQKKPDLVRVVEEITPRPVETPEQTAAITQIEMAKKRAEEEFARDMAEAAAEIDKKSQVFKLDPTDANKNLIRDAQSNLETIDGQKQSTNPYSIPTAIDSIKKFKKDYPLLYTIALTRHKLNIPRDRHIPVGELAQKFDESRKVKDALVERGVEPPTKKSLWQLITGTGGTTLTKTKHKSNHKAKAKTQSKPKHKNKSKPKPKHRVKPKTIKKNKRAHHKFDKKYTRKR